MSKLKASLCGLLIGACLSSLLVRVAHPDLAFQTELITTRESKLQPPPPLTLSHVTRLSAMEHIAQSAVAEELQAHQGFRVPQEPSCATTNSCPIKKKLLAIMILSGVRNEKRRNEVRESWGQFLDSSAVLKFLIAKDPRTKTNRNGLTSDLKKSIDIEQEKYGDIVYLNMGESYDSLLTVKVLEGFKYAFENVEYDYYLKCDDDTFFDFNEFKAVVNARKVPHSRLFWGMFHYNEVVWERTGAWARWAVDSYPPCDSYLPYAYGGGYIMTRDLIEFLVKEAAWFEPMRIEDAATGTYLSALDIVRKHDVRFDSGNTLHGCTNSRMVFHKQSLPGIYSNMLKFNGKKCESEAQIMKLYDWSKPPKECCPIGSAQPPENEQIYDF